MTRRKSAALAAAMGLFVAGAASAQNYPSHPVKLVVPFDAGGNVDINARFFAQQLSEQTKQPFVVENRPGASGYLGANFVSSSKSDGYTILYAGSSLTIAPALTKVPIDITRDLTAVSNVSMTPFVMVINNNIPARTLKELVAWIKQHPTDFKWAISAIGAADNLSTEVFNKLAGLKPAPLSVAYVGAGKSATAVMGGEVSGMLAPVSVVQSLVSGGSVRAIGLAAPVTMDAMPGVPTIGSEYPGYEAGAWAGVFGPKDMPADITKQLFDMVVKANADAEYLGKLKTTGSLSMSSKSPQDFAAYVKSQVESNSAIVKDVGIKIEQ